MNKRLLIVDDDYSIRTILEEALSSDDYKIRTVESGETALKYLTNEDVDLVITDLMMDGMSGIDLMDAVLKIKPNIGFLIITAYGTIKTAVDALHKGAFDFVTKPFSITHIKSRVSRYFEYEGLKQENIKLKRKLSHEKNLISWSVPADPCRRSTTRLTLSPTAMPRFSFREKAEPAKN